MAKNKLICTCTLLLVLVLSHEMIHTEGRHLKIKKRTACVKCSSSNTVRGKKESDGQKTSDVHHKITPMAGFVEAFRPTTPGHSPGIGHSIQH
ncbi:hypothetical protein AQUCO_01500130v1 [Aquilegia coerulea]|uniref:Uncharacterized protein n=1 Tax=Aquilegia coerulea TaxID=218851 RepID=A0A2G5DS81_AQUCA|nr:hypothetical protein AQUCO_01500130v1 [Aquilegia coerulea]